MVLVRVSGETGFEPPAKENLWSDSNYEWGNLWGGVHKAGKPVGRVTGRRENGNFQPLHGKKSTTKRAQEIGALS